LIARVSVAVTARAKKAETPTPKKWRRVVGRMGEMDPGMKPGTIRLNMKVKTPWTPLKGLTLKTSNDYTRGQGKGILGEVPK
jgi:hypothetical protein